MAITSYSGLIGEINTWLSRNDLTAAADTYLTLGQERLSTDLRIRANEVTLNATLSGGAALAPTDLVQLKHVFIKGTPVKPLEVKEAPWIYDQFPDRTSAEEARHVAEDGANFVFGPSGTDGGIMSGMYWKKPAYLNNATFTVNEWTENYPHALFFACLAEAAHYLMNSQDAMVWETKYEQTADRIRKTEKKRMRRGSRIALDSGIYNR